MRFAWDTLMGRKGIGLRLTAYLLWSILWAGVILVGVAVVEWWGQ